MGCWGLGLRFVGDLASERSMLLQKTPENLEL